MGDGPLDDIPQGGWKAAHGWAMPEPVEPILVVLILLLAMYFTRRREYAVLGPKARYEPVVDEESPRSSNELDVAAEHRANPHPPKARSLLWMRFETPNSSRFARHIHSRILQKFPFLVEMFYWGISFAVYRATKDLAAAYYGGQKSMWDNARVHGITILEAEALLWGGGRDAPQRWLEWRIQRWFLHGSEAGDARAWLLTILNRGYALVHVPGTVFFVAYFYATTKSHPRFCTIRRTLTWTNLLAMCCFVILPTMPPRLLPKRYDFVDTVSLEDAESVWMAGDFVNKLAAFPSMHFGWSFCVGCVFVADSGVLDGVFSWLDDYEDGGALRKTTQSRTESAVKFLVGTAYPAFVLTAIIATANHYFLDAFAAILVAAMALASNRVLLVFLPLEDWLLWALRLEKPVPTTGRKRSLVIA
ncbi:Uncharacterized protein TPAR_07331 [Tolypocladium paradoxum]|uniref:Inositolphosphotransferase Aur1/Ipt1 domain-containing protein n=1 Tax=Tolypocladium paradoxum TaxID=94208 RepID=A0A2S4KQJ0_9HYPO|nr:Uncharacterized protein TPAR_07331 [Tolypocladium paradoxum]